MSDDESENDQHLVSDNDAEDQEQQQPTMSTAAPKSKKRKQGIIYISSLPKNLNVAMIRELFEKYGEVKRIFLQPKEKLARKKPKKMKAVHFTEGWLEFDSKRVAKNVAGFLNNTPISTKKGSKFYDVLWNIKYLSRFKWTHLSERLTYEKAVQRQKMQVEVAQARKEASFFQNNLDKSEKDKKMAKRMKAVKVAS